DTRPYVLSSSTCCRVFQGRCWVFSSRTSCWRTCATCRSCLTWMARLPVRSPHRTRSS
ncbi:MAG: hypothetical protein CYPHOPRED_005856, partial [Cyphobasidiales sp. Tagirdzhanova-0007]